MVLTSDRLSIWWSFIRSSPITNLFYPLVLSIHKPSYSSIYFLISYLIVFITNGLEKGVSMCLYNTLNIDTLPIIGSGKRPDGATNCGSYLVYPDKLAISYGMPSGHSELSWFFSTYIILDLIYNIIDNTKNINKTPSYYILAINSGLLLSYAFINSYARVVIENCHTKGQVIVGGIIGVIKGLILYYFYRIYIR